MNQIERSQLLPFYESIVKNTSIGIHVIDRSGKTIIYNEKMKEIEGLEFEDVIDRSFVEVFQWNEEDSTLLKVLQTSEPILNVRQTYWNQKGQEISTINDTYPVFQEGALIGAIEFSRNVTDLEKLMLNPLKKYDEPITFSVITAVSNEMKRVIERSQKAASVRLPVLLIGEAGTGKELIAEAIHFEQSTERQDFFVVYAHAVTAEQIENVRSFLFSRNQATVFFERIDLLSNELQTQLLEVVREHTASDHLLIASVGQDPIELIQAGGLKKELYYIFSSITIYLPPLRERMADLEPFINDYLLRHRTRFNSNVETLSPEVIQLFESYDWPGNLKELELILDEMAAMLRGESLITTDMLPAPFKQKLLDIKHPSKRAEDFVVQTDKELVPLEEYLREAELYYLQKAMNKFDQNVTKAAAALGMSRQSLQYRLRKLRNSIK